MPTTPSDAGARRLVAPAGTGRSRSTAGEDRDDRPRPRDAEEMSHAECAARLSVLLRCP